MMLAVLVMMEAAGRMVSWLFGGVRSGVVVATAVLPATTVVAAVGFCGIVSSCRRPSGRRIICWPERVIFME